jgi:polyvinyl alcohol dehydrogenase (cytochrome)
LRPSYNRPRLAQADANDWPTYNHDVRGSRYNQGETAIGRDNSGRLEEKWRFPAKDSGQKIGAMHATPVIVGGYVYFGTTGLTPFPPFSCTFPSR